MSYIHYSLKNLSYEDIQLLAGEEDVHFQLIKKHLKTELVLRDDEIKIEETPNSEMVKEVLNKCLELIDEHNHLHPQDVSYLIGLAKHHTLNKFQAKHLTAVGKTKSGKIIYPKTLGQAIMHDALLHNDIVFATGVAGTGKTYLSVVYAVNQLQKEKVEKIILTRPAVEAGESLGFLPGDMKEKVDPYLRSLYDALYDMLGQETVDNLIEKQVIEIAPLAFMRGRTLNHAIVILDEAQNTTQAQMKMFLTRLGDQAQMIINGDATQIDLIKKKESGLEQACNILNGVEGIAMIHLSGDDVVRHPLVQKIIDRYAKIEK